jgi:ribosomal protein RSM22 (predicted rRNA methylase)
MSKIGAVGSRSDCIQANITLETFRSRIENAARGFPTARLAEAFDALVERYDAGRATPTGLSPEEVAAYAIGRAPGTYAAVAMALGEVARLRPGWRPSTLLDVGAGIGSAAWAASNVFDSLEAMTLVERSPEMIAFGRSMLGAEWIEGDLLEERSGRWDLVIAAYVLGELIDDAVVERWFERAGGELVIVEAGTPAGFDRIRRARARLIELGATITAPCPHERDCPMPAHDWCHFGVRVQRSRLQREVKAGSRGFEDEKYSYVVASKHGPVDREPRVLRRPVIRTGHVRLNLCADDGLREVVISRRHRDTYKDARKVRWGEAFRP